jgi:hypothetical protein
MTSIDTSVLFSIQTNLYCYISSLYIKRVDALESRNVWASIVTNLLHLTMIGIKKHGVGFEDRLRPFSLHDPSRSNLVNTIKIGHVCFLTPLIVGW